MKTQNDKLCSVEGCDKKHEAKGYCSRHYAQFSRSGVVKLIKNTFGLSDKEKVEYYSNKTDSCWLWSGHRNKNGYGVIYSKGRVMLAHRFAYEAFIGKLPDNMSLCHRCDVPYCVNPDHLFIGTQQDNARDSFGKGRVCKTSHTSKLKPEAVFVIRELIASGAHTYRALSKRFGVCETSIGNIASGKTWGWLTEDNALFVAKGGKYD